MHPRRRNRFSAPMRALAGLAVICPLIFCEIIPAETDWLKKGADIFKRIQREKVSAGPNLADFGEAFKEALRIGTEKVVGQLGTVDGFNADPAVHIPLPEEFGAIRSVLEKVGMSSSLNDLELRLNRAAEAATPKAKAIFLRSVSAMTFDDVMKIYNGPEDGATRYFQEKMTPALTEAMAPVVDGALSEVGAIQVYEGIMGRYQTIPFVPDVKSDLIGHVIDKGLAGIFLYVAREEAAIRKDPARRTTDLLKRVFGSK